jgi:hypothetical protein
MGMKQTWNKFRELVRGLGARHAPYYVAQRILSRLGFGHARIERFILVAQPVPDKPRLPATRAKDVSIVELHVGHPLLANMPRPPEIIADRFRQGSHCLAAVRDGRMLGYLWLILDGYDEDMARLRFQLPSPACAWDFDVFVFPEHRLGFTFLKLWDGTDAWLRERGVRYSLSRISAFNAGSRSSHGGLGARPVGLVTVLVAGGMELMWSGCPPRLRLSGPRTRPVLRLPDPGLTPG